MINQSTREGKELGEAFDYKGAARGVRDLLQYIGRFTGDLEAVENPNLKDHEVAVTAELRNELNTPGSPLYNESIEAEKRPDTTEAFRAKLAYETSQRVKRRIYDKDPYRMEALGEIRAQLNDPNDPLYAESIKNDYSHLRPAFKQYLETQVEGRRQRLLDDAKRKRAAIIEAINSGGLGWPFSDIDPNQVQNIMEGKFWVPNPDQVTNKTSAVVTELTLHDWLNMTNQQIDEFEKTGVTPDIAQKRKESGGITPGPQDIVPPAPSDSPHAQQIGALFGAASRARERQFGPPDKDEKSIIGHIMNVGSEISQGAIRGMAKDMNQRLVSTPSLEAAQQNPTVAPANEMEEYSKGIRREITPDVSTSFAGVQSEDFKRVLTDPAKLTGLLMSAVKGAKEGVEADDRTMWAKTLLETQEKNLEHAQTLAQKEWDSFSDVEKAIIDDQHGKNAAQGPGGERLIPGKELWMSEKIQQYARNLNHKDLMSVFGDEPNKAQLAADLLLDAFNFVSPAGVVKTLGGAALAKGARAGWSALKAERFNEEASKAVRGLGAAANWAEDITKSGFKWKGELDQIDDIKGMSDEAKRALKLEMREASGRALGHEEQLQQHMHDVLEGNQQGTLAGLMARAYKKQWTGVSETAKQLATYKLMSDADRLAWVEKGDIVKKIGLSDEAITSANAAKWKKELDHVVRMAPQAIEGSKDAYWQAVNRDMWRAYRAAKKSNIDSQKLREKVEPIQRSISPMTWTDYHKMKDTLSDADKVSYRYQLWNASKARALEPLLEAAKGEAKASRELSASANAIFDLMKKLEQGEYETIELLQLGKDLKQMRQLNIPPELREQIDNGIELLKAELVNRGIKDKADIERLILQWQKSAQIKVPEAKHRAAVEKLLARHDRRSMDEIRKEYHDALKLSENLPLVGRSMRSKGHYDMPYVLNQAGDVRHTVADEIGLTESKYRSLMSGTSRARTRTGERTDWDILLDPAEQTKAALGQRIAVEPKALELRLHFEALTKAKLVETTGISNHAKLIEYAQTLSKERGIEYVAIEPGGKGEKALQRILANEGEFVKKGLVVPRFYADLAEDYIKLGGRPNEWQRFTGPAMRYFFLPAQSTLKLANTILFPAFHVTNAVGAGQLGMVTQGFRAANPKLQASALAVGVAAVVSTPANSWKRLEASSNLAEVLDAVYDTGKGKVTFREILNYLRDHAGIGQGLKRVGVTSYGGGPLSWVPQTIEKAAAKSGLKSLAQMTDDYQKAFAFMANLKGTTRLHFQEALDKAIHEGFIYSRMSKIDQRMNHWFAFYMFARQSVPLIATKLVTNPARVTALNKVKQYLDRKYTAETGKGIFDSSVLETKDWLTSIHTAEAELQDKGDPTGSFIVSTWEQPSRALTSMFGLKNTQIGVRIASTIILGYDPVDGEKISDVNFEETMGEVLLSPVRRPYQLGVDLYRYFWNNRNDKDYKDSMAEVALRLSNALGPLGKVVSSQRPEGSPELKHAGWKQHYRVTPKRSKNVQMLEEIKARDASQRRLDNLLNK